jgi:phosphatidylglycerol:prolipoprotein diacylglycerol transferase
VFGTHTVFSPHKKGLIMYPDFQYLFQSLLNNPMPEWLGIFKTFGFLMALAFIAGLMVMSREMIRYEKLGMLQPIEGDIEYVHEETGKKETRKGLIYPHERVSTILMIAAIGGLVGAKIFNALETWEYFIQDPIDSLFSRSGLTFYGGLILATALLYFYAKKYKIPFATLCDTAAPALILAYGIGRLGCHFSGDGDWGIFNSAYITDTTGHLQAASKDAFQQMLQTFPEWFMRYGDVKNMNELSAIPHGFTPAPSWLPDWFMGMNYAHNVNNEGVMIPECVGNYCAVLPVSVYPTALYEAIVCIFILFPFLWMMRKRFAQPLHIFGLYLIVNGLERFFVEKIRVNYKYDWGFIHPTQAEIISSCLVFIGIGILLFYKKKKEVITA